MLWLYKILDYFFDKLGEFIDRWILNKRAQAASQERQAEIDSEKSLQNALQQRQLDLQQVEQKEKEKVDEINQKSDSAVLRED